MYKTYKDNNELFMSIVFRKHGDDLCSKNKRVYRLKRKNNYKKYLWSF